MEYMKIVFPSVRLVITQKPDLSHFSIIPSFSVTESKTNMFFCPTTISPNPPSKSMSIIEYLNPIFKLKPSVVKIKYCELEFGNWQKATDWVDEGCP